MKNCQSLLFVILLSCIQTAYAKHEAKHLQLSILNNTGVHLKEIGATFRFSGDNSLHKKFIDGSVKVSDVKKNSTVYLNSADAMFEGESVESFFKPAKHDKKRDVKRRLADVELIKLSAGRWKIRGTNFKLRSARAQFEPGTQKTNFIISIKKNRFGFPSYVIEPIGGEIGATR